MRTISKALLRPSLYISLLLLLTAAPEKAEACSNCPTPAHEITRELIEQEHDNTQDHITEEFMKHQNWLAFDFFENYIAVAMMRMTNTLSATGIQQVALLGAFFDADQQLDNQLAIQQLTARAHKDYHPTLELCSIGTAATSLAAADRIAEVTSSLLSRTSQNRQLKNVNASSSRGPLLDRAARLLNFKKYYCDKADNNMGLNDVCEQNVPPERINNDIDFARVFGDVMTLDIDFIDNAQPPTPGEVDLMALNSNLYSHNVFLLLSKEVLSVDENEDDYLDMRAVLAKRSLAESSFHAIAGMKAAGSADSQATGDFASVVLRQLGMSPDEARFLVGDRPSYYALLEILAQKLYQDPEFFTNLYDKPANVARKDVAMQAINLMLDRDSYRSELRYEAMLSLFLAMETDKYQEAVRNRIDGLGEGDRLN